MTEARTGFVTSGRFAEHDTGPGHPECAARIDAIVRQLEASGTLSELVTADAAAADTSAIERVHPARFVEHVRTEVEAGARWVDSSDAVVCPASFEVARLATGAALHATDQVMAGHWKNAFVAARPPGHHAEESLAMGFCLFNNAAIVARHAQTVHGLERVAIVDWDVHHGNGTQHIFERDASVFYASLHQFPHYPGTGARSERGQGEGLGATLNCPMPAGSGDTAWVRALGDEILPALDEFRPQLVVVSAGFDAHERDPLSATLVTTRGFGLMSEALLDLARRHCGGRVVSLLEGGYDLVGLAESADTHVRALLSA